MVTALCRTFDDGVRNSIRLVAKVHRVRVAAFLVLDRLQTGDHVERLRGIFRERAGQAVIHAFHGFRALVGILRFGDQVHHLGEVFRAAAKFKIEVRFHLIEKIAPGAGIKRRTLHQRGLDGLGQKVRLEYAYVLDPRAMLGNDGIAFVKFLERVIAELDEFQFKEGQVLARRSRSIPAERRRAWP